MIKFINYIKKSSKEPITQNQSDQEDFYELTKKLIQYQNNAGHSKDIENIIKQLILYAIKGDNELHKSLFELFMEKDILSRLYDIMQKYQCPIVLIQQIFEQVCSLLLNIKEVTNKNYILSHNCISNMVLWKTHFEFSNPNIELVETYISFLNLLAVKLDDITSMFFINIKYPQFPLLWNAVRFHSHPELMVRNKSRSIVLHILNIKNQNIMAYTSSFPFTYYYYCLGDQLLLTIKQINNIVEQIQWNFQNQKHQNLHTITEELKEQLQYIHDLIINNQNLEQVILDYALQRSIIFLQQVIKFRMKHISLTVALYVFYLFLRSFQNSEKTLQYFLMIFQIQDQPNILIPKDIWEYSNVLDQDPQFIYKICKQIYSTLECVDLEQIQHENLDIKLCLQRIKQIDCMIVQQFDKQDFYQKENDILNIIFMHKINKDTLIYVLLLYKQLNNPLTEKKYLIEITELVKFEDQQLVVLMLALDVLLEQKNILDIRQLTQNLFIHIIKEIILNIQLGQLFMDQLIDLFKKKMTQLEQDFLIGEQINFKQQDHPVFFDPYNSLSHQQKIQFCILLSQHSIFTKYPSVSEQMPELTKLQVQGYQIGEKIDCQKIPCYYSETGQFYNTEVYYILKIDNFLHIVQLDENQVITDVINSKLWQLIQVYGLETSLQLQFTYFDFSKFYLRLQTIEDVAILNAQSSQQQQNFSDWFKELLIVKLQTLLN